MPAVELTVIDSAGGTASYHAQRTYPDFIPAISVTTMVDGIVERLSRTAGTPTDPAAIGLLRVIGHGSPGEQRMGDSRFSTNPRQVIALDARGRLINREVLTQLRGYFAPNAVVELHGCNVGAGSRGEALRQALERVWGVRVRAGGVVQDAGTPGLDRFVRIPHYR
jgi:hypothetical protein